MGLLSVVSAKGSPGATTTALLLGALWPRPTVLAECDPSGSDVAWRMPSNEVQVELLRSVQPPEEVQPMPAAENCDAALDWVTADAGATAPKVRPRAERRVSRTVRRMVPEIRFMCSTLTMPGDQLARGRFLSGVARAAARRAATTPAAGSSRAARDTS